MNQFIKQTWAWLKQVPKLTVSVLTVLWTLTYSFSLIGLAVYTLAKIVPYAQGYTANALTLASAVAAASGLIVFIKFCVHQSQPATKKK
jgi:hypothetical protein